MTIDPRLACHMAAACCGEPIGPDAADLLAVLDAAIAEDARLATEYDRYRRHMPDYDVRTVRAKAEAERVR